MARANRTSSAISTNSPSGGTPAAYRTAFDNLLGLVTRLPHASLRDFVDQRSEQRLPPNA